MSIKIMNLVWERAPYKGNTLLTLLALADWSNDEGVSWPHMKKLGAKSRQSLRSTNYSIEKLCADGFVDVRVNPGRGNQNEFHINLQHLQLLREPKTCNPRHKNLQSTTGKPANGDNAIRKNRQEPSENHQNPPIVPAERGLTPRQLQNLSRELDEIYRMGLGATGARDFDEQALRKACVRLCLPLDVARKAIAASEGRTY